MEYGPPGPAVAGLKLLPLIPVPLKVPPEGMPVRLIVPALTQAVVDKPVKLTTGNAFTVTGWLILLLQPFPSVYE